MLGSVKLAALGFDLVAQVLAESEKDQVGNGVVVHSGGSTLAHPLDVLARSHRVWRVGKLLPHNRRELVEQREVPFLKHNALGDDVGLARIIHGGNYCAKMNLLSRSPLTLSTA